MQPLVDAFEQDHPEIKIDLRVMGSGDEYREQMMVWALAGELPDIVQLDGQSGGIPELVGTGALMDLTTRFERDIDTTDLMPNSLVPNQHTFEGKVYGVPSILNAPQILFVANRELFNASGVPLPETDWTQSDLIQIGKKLTRRNSDGTTSQWGIVFPHLFRYPVWIWSGGGQLFDDPIHPTKSLIDEPEAVSSIEWLADLNRVHGIAVNGQDPDVGIGNAVGMFRNKQGGLGLFSYTWAVNNYSRGNFDFDWSLATIPKGPGGSLSQVKDNPWFIAANSEHPDAAWTYLKWRLSPKAQRLAVSINQGWAPVLRSEIDNDWLYPSGPPHDMTPVVNQDARTLFSFEGSSAIDVSIRNGINEVWTGQKSAKQMTSALADQIDGKLKEIFGDK